MVLYHIKTHYIDRVAKSVLRVAPVSVFLSSIIPYKNTLLLIDKPVINLIWTGVSTWRSKDTSVFLYGITTPEEWQSLV